jgi:aconitase A
MTSEKVKNVLINESDCKVSLIDNKITLQKKGYKGSWVILTKKQLEHEDVEDAETKKWVSLSDTEPTYTKEIKSNLVITKPTVHGSSTPEEALAKLKPAVKEEKPVRVKKRKEGGKVSKLTTEEAVKLAQG